MSDKVIRKFSDYMHEDGPKFLQEFESYLTLSGVDNEQRIIAAFHRHLKLNNFREALHSAKIGEAHGYRVHAQTPSII